MLQKCLYLAREYSGTKVYKQDFLRDAILYMCKAIESQQTYPPD